MNGFRFFSSNLIYNLSREKVSKRNEYFICLVKNYTSCCVRSFDQFLHKDNWWLKFVLVCAWSPGNTPNPPRPRFNSCRSEPRSSASDLCSSVFSSAMSLVTTTSNSVLTNGNAESASEVSLSRSNLSSLRSGTPMENGSAGYLSTATSTSTVSLNGNVCGTTVYSTAPTVVATSTTTMTTTTTTSSVVSLTDKPPMIPNDGTRSSMASYRDQPASSASPPTRDKLRAEDKARRRMNQQGERTSGIINDGTGTTSGEKLGRYPTRNAFSPFLTRRRISSDS